MSKPPSKVEGTRSDRQSPYSCPACGAPARRIHRRAQDRLLEKFGSHVRRFGCSQCQWTGLLQVSAPTLLGSSRHAHAPLAWLVGGLLTLVVLLALPMLWIGSGATDDSTPAMPATGVALDPADPRALADGQYELRRGCTWAGPGTAPYSGPFGAALIASGIPSEIVAKLEIMRERGLASDRVIVSGDGIESTDRRRQFGDTATAMTLGRVICFATRIDLLSDTIMTADLYEIVDGMNRRYAVMVVEPDGNVVILQEQVEPR